MLNKIAFLIHPGHHKELKDSTGEFNTTQLSWILNTMNEFNKNGADYRIVQMDLDEKEGVINLNAETSSKEKKGVSLIIGK